MNAGLLGVMLGDRWLARRRSPWQEGVSRRLLGTLRRASVASCSPARSLSGFTAR